MKRLILLITYVFALISLYANNSLESTDSAYCFVLEDKYLDTNLSRAKFVLEFHDITKLKKYRASIIKDMIPRLKFKENLDYSTREIAMDWNVINDTTISLYNLTPPVKALLVLFKPYVHKKNIQ